MMDDPFEIDEFAASPEMRLSDAPAPAYLDNLNAEQRDAVETLDGPVSYTHLTLPTTPYV